MSLATTRRRASTVCGDLTIRDDVEFNSPVTFDDLHTAQRAFIGAGPMQLAIQRSGERIVADAVREALAPFIAADGHITVPAWWRVVLTRPEAPQS